MTRSLTLAENALSLARPAVARYAESDADTRAAMYRSARDAFTRYRAPYGFGPARKITTSGETQPKLAKAGVPTTGLMLLPHKQSGMYRLNLCPSATSCSDVCLVDSDKGRIASVRQARLVRTRFMFERPSSALIMALHETLAGARLHRPNVTSDIRWEFAVPDYVTLLQAAGIGVYDYTKYHPRLRGDLYPLTFSATERHTLADIRALVESGRNVAVVFAASKRTVIDACERGALWHGMPMTDGISTDDRTSDPIGTIVALAALGKARADASGFVRPWDNVT